MTPPAAFLIRLPKNTNWRGAEAESRRALALATEPRRANWYVWLPIYLSALNRLDEAERAVRRAMELEPAATGFHAVLTIIEVLRGKAQAALAAAQEGPPGWIQDDALALARQIGSDRSAADAALRTMIDQHANKGAYQIAEIYALRNDAKATFEWLDRACSNRDGGIGYLLFDPREVASNSDLRDAPTPDMLTDMDDDIPVIVRMHVECAQCGHAGD